MIAMKERVYMINYEVSMPTKIIYGEGRHKEIGKWLVKYGFSKVLLVYGGGSIKNIGLYDTVIGQMKENGIEWMELSGIKSNPTLEPVYEGIRICRENGIGHILAVGGGSAIDTAKAIALGVPYDGDVWNFFGRFVYEYASEGKNLPGALPTANILTIPGTGSESGANTVISNAQTQEKIGIFDDCLRPVFTIMDPTLCVTIPKNQIASPVYDMLSHTMERYFESPENKHTDVVDGIAEGLMRGVIKNGLAVYKDPGDVAAWGELMLAADFSHNGVTGFGKDSDWTNHGTEEVISGIYNIPHGAGLSIVTPAWMKYVYKKHPEQFAQFAQNVMGIQGSFREPERLAMEGIQALENFSRQLGLPTRLSEFDIDDSQFEFMAQRACDYKPSHTLGAVEKLSWEDVVEIYKLAL